LDADDNMRNVFELGHLVAHSPPHQNAATVGLQRNEARLKVPQ
jgi:hypothetical protein